MNRLTRWLPSRRFLVIPPIVLGVLVVGYLASSKKPLPRTEVSERAVPIDAMEASLRSVRPSVTGYGVAAPKRIWTAVAEVGGAVTEIHPELRDGNAVRNGVILAQIDEADYRLRIQQRQSELDSAIARREQLEQGLQADKASLELQRSLLDVRKSEVDRLRTLRGNSAASISETDTARAAYLQQALSVKSLERTLAVTPAQIDSASAEIELAQSRLAEADRDLQRTRITAPFPGLLVDVDLQVGQYVAPGQTLFQLHDASTMEIESQFSLAQLSRLIDSDPSKLAERTLVSTETINSDIPRTFATDEFLNSLVATVFVRSGDVAIAFVGKPVRTTATIDPTTRTLGVMVQVDAEDRWNEARAVALRGGAYCEVVLERETEIKQVVLPRTAVQHGRVYLVDDDNRLAGRAVQTRLSLGRSVVVEGVRPGERVAIQPPVSAATGLLVDPNMVEDRFDNPVIPANLGQQP